MFHWQDHAGYRCPPLRSDMRGLSWRELSHKQVCGATTGSWLIGTNCTIKKKLFWSSEVSRNLSHSLSKVESGVEVTSGKRTSSYKGMPVFRGKDRAPPGVKDIAVEYSSAYKRDKPVLRSITDREMMDVYDVEIPTIVDLSSDLRQVHNEISHFQLSHSQARRL